MGRKLIAAVAAVTVLGLAGIAVAGTHEGYQGSIGVGHLQFGTTFQKGEPKTVNRFSWSNVPATCPTPFQISDEFKSPMRVDKDGRFHGKGPAENNPNATVKITGRFKHHDEVAVGTFRMYGAAAGCSQLETGVVDWEANQRPG